MWHLLNEARDLADVATALGCHHETEDTSSLKIEAQRRYRGQEVSMRLMWKARRKIEVTKNLYVW